MLSFKPINPDNQVYFRGESEDYKDSALTPGIYRSQARHDHLAHEHDIYREMQRFNDHEFDADKTAFDKLSRMQHYQAPTRLLDLSEDVLSALYFALLKAPDCHVKSNKKAVLYLLEISKESVKYYDSDAVSVVANLAKSPLMNGNGFNGTEEKSKTSIVQTAKKLYEDKIEFNKSDCVAYLLHDIKEEKCYFSPKVQPRHLFSILFVKPKLTNNRLHGQKGAFLLFGLNPDDVGAAIPIIEYSSKKPRLNVSLSLGTTPIVKISKIMLSNAIKMCDLEKLGITKPFIYPEMDKVAEFLTAPRSN